MHIEDFEEKFKNGSVTLEFAESGRLVVLERRFDPTTGVPTLKPSQETDSREMEGTVAESQKRVADAQKILDDDLAMQKHVLAKEAERTKIEEKAKK